MLYILERSKNKGDYIPLTARQLEALIRISESLARMCLSDEVNEEHVRQAYELFKQSTLNITDMDSSKANQNSSNNEIINLIETFVLNRIAVGNSVMSQRLMQELNAKFPSNVMAVNIAVTNLIKKGDLVKENNGKVLLRK